MATKLLGLGIFLLGFLIFTKLPWILGYQSESMGNAGVFVGLILMGIGVYLFLT
ncbi:MAG: hypothetical protein QXQ18_00870 [Candidatus Aenigmatarchaeota archaeon]